MHKHKVFTEGIPTPDVNAAEPSGNIFLLYVASHFFCDKVPDYNVRAEKAQQRMSRIRCVVCVCKFYFCPDEFRYTSGLDAKEAEMTQCEYNAHFHKGCCVR